MLNGEVVLAPNCRLCEPVTFAAGIDNFVVRENPAANLPEPATLLLLGTGLAGVVGAARRRRKARSGRV